jgi:RNA polymerase sigma factor (TIGR02999 family)
MLCMRQRAPVPANESENFMASPPAQRRDTTDTLSTLLYHDLRRIARSQVRRLPSGATLQATALIHEAYLRLAGRSAGFAGRTHFARVAARAMRNVLVDRARARHAGSRGGGAQAVVLDTELAAVAGDDARILSVHDALEQLAKVDAQLVEIVEQRYFAGLGRDEIAAALGDSPRTVDRGWRLARAWWRAQRDNDGG